MSMRVATRDKTAMVGSFAELLGMVSMAVHAVPDSLLFPFPFRMIYNAFNHNAPRGMSDLARCSSNSEVLAMTTLRPREGEISRYRHGCDPPRKAKAVSPSDCKSLDILRPPRAATSPASTQSLIRSIQLKPSLLVSVFHFRPK
jgi:hypothetical protein